MKKLLIFFLVLAFFAGCRGFLTQQPDWIQTGPYFEPYKGKVDLFSDAQEIKRAYGNLGLARMKNVPQKRGDVQSAINVMSKFAASKGATGLLIGQEKLEDSPPGTIMLVGYAIKYADTITEADKRAIDEFNLIGVVDEYKK